MTRLFSTRRSRTRRGFRPTLDLLETRLAPALFVVNTLADVVDPDADVTSLREAIQDANAIPGADTINFLIAGEISVATALPFLTDASGGTTIDATTAPGYAGAPVVSLFGPATTTGVHGLLIGSANNTVRGLQIGNFHWAIEMSSVGAINNAVEACYLGTNGIAAVPNSIGILTSNGAANTRIGTNGDGVNDAAEGNVISGNAVYGVSSAGAGGEIIAGNKIGTNAAGTAALPHGAEGIRIGGGGFNRIGTNADGVSDALERNLISGNQGFGVVIAGASARNNDVLGNFIGTDVTGTAALPNQLGGVFVFLGAFNNRIGSFSSAGRNVIAGNTAALAPFGLGGGVVFSDVGTTSNQVTNNAIGTDLTGTIDLGNVSHGIQITNGAGNVQIAQNVSAFNDGDGVHMTSTAGAGCQISSNSFFSNGGLGINLVSATDNASDVTPNDPLDADSGPNNLQNAPVIAKAVRVATGTAVTYSLHSTPNTFFLMQFRVSPTADPSGFGEGKTFVAQRGLTTDVNGNASETFTTGFLPVGQAITATAFGLGSTSEFSNAATVVSQRIWTGGGTTTNWTEGANWGGTAPVAGDHLVFPAGTPTSSNNDYPAGTLFGALTYTGGNHVAAGNTITLGPSGIVASAGQPSLNLNVATDAQGLPIDSSGGTLTINGVVSGTGGLTITGFGGVILEGDNTYDGQTQILSGVAVINGQQPQSAVLVDGGSFVQGEGVVGPLTMLNGFFSPAAGPTGTLTVTGDAEFGPSPAAQVFFNLGGPTDSPKADQLVVLGEVDLTSAPALGFGGSIPGPDTNVGEELVLIDNDGTDPVLGTFAFSPEATIYTFSDAIYQLTYVGGTGNDVALKHLSTAIIDGNLWVSGNSFDDQIVIAPAGRRGVEVFLNDVSQGRFALTADAQIIVHGLGGDDSIAVTGNIDNTGLLFGDAGNDRITGGKGNNVLSGGTGDDILRGKGERDVLIGGYDADRLSGFGEQDLLIAGTYTFEDNEIAVSSILAEWVRTDQTYTQRVDHLRNGGGLNGGFKLNGLSVHDDLGAVDRLAGGQGRDWFFANTLGAGAFDLLTDHDPLLEFVDELQ